MQPQSKMVDDERLAQQTQVQVPDRPLDTSDAADHLLVAELGGLRPIIQAAGSIS